MQPFVEALNNLHNSGKAQQPQQTHQQQPQSQPTTVREFPTEETTGAIMANPAITTTTTSTTILSKVGMSGGSVTYTNLGNITKFECFSCFFFCSLHVKQFEWQTNRGL